MQKQKIKILFLTAKPPFLVGLYSEDGVLLESKELADAKASDILPVVIEELLEMYEPMAVYYANGPGNQMSIKVSFVCLKTLAISKNIPLMAASSFCFNGFMPIELANKRFFCFENGNIAIKYSEQMQDVASVLPRKLDSIDFGYESEPVYILPPA